MALAYGTQDDTLLGYVRSDLALYVTALQQVLNLHDDLQGPIANWGFVLAGVADTQKDPALLSPNMTGGPYS